uniref:Uncharacterized protein n=1 Tax=Arundo donax TaxID=35708 RepID=A0A0A9A024_ARUDO
MVTEHQETSRSTVPSMAAAGAPPASHR